MLANKSLKKEEGQCGWGKDTVLDKELAGKTGKQTNWILRQTRGGDAEREVLLRLLRAVVVVVRDGVVFEALAGHTGDVQQRGGNVALARDADSGAVSYWKLWTSQESMKQASEGEEARRLGTGPQRIPSQGVCGGGGATGGAAKGGPDRPEKGEMLGDGVWR